jgi:hypothetical protein
MAELKEGLPQEAWARMLPPTDAQLGDARRRLRVSSNPFGVLLADALLATDVAANERLRRRRLYDTLTVGRLFPRRGSC